MSGSGIENTASTKPPRFGSTLSAIASRMASSTGLMWPGVLTATRPDGATTRCSSDAAAALSPDEHDDPSATARRRRKSPGRGSEAASPSAHSICGAGGGRLGCDGEHVGRDVDTDDRAVRAHDLGSCAGDHSRATRDVDNSLARLQVGNLQQARREAGVAIDGTKNCWYNWAAVPEYSRNEAVLMMVPALQWRMSAPPASRDEVIGRRGCGRRSVAQAPFVGGPGQPDLDRRAIAGSGRSSHAG